MIEPIRMVANGTSTGLTASMIRTYVQQYNNTKDRFTRNKDLRYIGLNRLLWQLDPYQHKLINCDIFKLRDLNAALYHLNAAGWALSKYPTMSTAGALTIEALSFILRDISESYAAKGPVAGLPSESDITYYAKLLFPELDRLVSDSLLERKYFYMPNVTLLENEGISVRLSGDARTFRIQLLAGFIQMEMQDESSK